MIDQASGTGLVAASVFCDNADPIPPRRFGIGMDKTNIVQDYNRTILT